MIRLRVENISKKFNLDVRREESALAKVIRILNNKQEKRELQVLKDISFEAESGQVIGLIGKNGAGKSTLLKLIAGIYQPTEGKIKTVGSFVYLNSLGLGLASKLTMRENIYLSGYIMGLDRYEINQRFNQIVDFSGLKDFLDCKIYQFSDGMISRLSFSITFFCVKHKNPDILLVDEVFGTVGDADFETKANQKMEEVIKGESTVIMASHNMDIIEKYCQKTLFLENGKLANFGNSKDIAKIYKES